MVPCLQGRQYDFGFSKSGLQQSGETCLYEAGKLCFIPLTFLYAITTVLRHACSGVLSVNLPCGWVLVRSSGKGLAKGVFMAMVIQLVLLAVGFVLLVKGADWFVDGAASIAGRLGIPQLVIGLTIVAMGTSAPEAAVSLTAAFHGNADITIGNVVGSNILNILIILGLAAVICPMMVAKVTVWVDIPVTIASTLILLVLGLDGKISRLDAVILLAVFVSYLSYLFIMTKKGKIQGETEEEVNMTHSMPKALFLTALGLALIILGSNFAVDAASAIAKMLGLSERFIGLTIVALGTSLPELFTSVAAAIKKNPDMAIGNIVGSNIFNILFIVGLSGLVIPVPFAKPFRFDIMVAEAAVLLLFLLCLPKKRIGRLSGIIMLAGYVAYFAMIW